MKKSIFVLVFMCLSMASFCQYNIDNAPKKANTVIITRSGDALTLLKELIVNLQDKGYFIDKFEKELLSVETKYKEFKYSGVYDGELKIILFARQIEEDKVKFVIKGEVKFGGKFTNEACNCGIGGDVRKKGFETMLEALSAFRYETISYEKN